jgi:hypothetical protein
VQARTGAARGGAAAAAAAGGGQAGATGRGGCWMAASGARGCCSRALPMRDGPAVPAHCMALCAALMGGSGSTALPSILHTNTNDTCTEGEKRTASARRLPSLAHLPVRSCEAQRLVRHGAGALVVAPVAQVVLRRLPHLLLVRRSSIILCARAV